MPIWKTERRAGGASEILAPHPLSIPKRGTGGRRDSKGVRPGFHGAVPGPEQGRTLKRSMRESVKPLGAHRGFSRADRKPLRSAGRRSRRTVRHSRFAQLADMLRPAGRMGRRAGQPLPASRTTGSEEMSRIPARRVAERSGALRRDGTGRPVACVAEPSRLGGDSTARATGRGIGHRVLRAFGQSPEFQANARKAHALSKEPIEGGQIVRGQSGNRAAL